MYSLLEELVTRGGYAPLQYITKDIILEGFQSFILAWALIVKRLLVNVDTGLGKSYIALGMMNCLDGTTLVISSKKPILNMIAKCNLPYVLVTGQDHYIKTLVKMEDVNAHRVIFMTHSALTNLSVQDWLVKNRRKFKCLIVDESHEVVYNDATVARIIEGLAKYSEYMLELSATPLRVSILQQINQLYWLVPEVIQDPKRVYNRYVRRDAMGKVVGAKDTDKFERAVFPHYFSFTRKDLGIQGEYNVDFLTCDAPDGVTGMRDLRKIYTPMYDRVEEVIEKGKTIIYANTNVIKDTYAEFLRRKGYNVGIFDGRYTKVIKPEEVDVLITNVTTSLDMDCNRIIFLELTSDFVQTIGRAERGFVRKDLDIYFCVFDSEEDANFYLNHIYDNAKLLKGFAKKNVDYILNNHIKE